MFASARGRSLVVALLAIASAVACSSGGINRADLPPKGTIVFADSFDPATFKTQGLRTTAKVQQPTSMVASLSTDQPDGATFTLDVERDGVKLGSIPGTVSNGPWAAYGRVITSLLDTAGTYHFSTLDSGGNLLAEGSLEVTP
jgi:hypothetical protein